MKNKIIEDYKITMNKHMPDRVNLIRNKKNYAYKIYHKFKFKPILKNSHLGILYNKQAKDWTNKDFTDAIEVINFYRSKPEYKVPDYKVKLPKKHNLFAKSIKLSKYKK